jgi:hypothetical protein
LREKSQSESTAGGISFWVNKSTGGYVGFDAYVVLAWNVFNDEDWRLLGSVERDWGFSLGPLGSKLRNLLGPGGKAIVTILDNKDNIQAAIDVVVGGVKDEIWHGKYGSAVFSYGIGVGGFTAVKDVRYHTYDFAIGH